MTRWGDRPRLLWPQSSHADPSMRRIPIGAERFAGRDLRRSRPTVERNGLARALELAAVRTAISQRSDLPPAAFLALNVSPRTAASADFACALKGVAPDRLVIEITEHAPIDDYDAITPGLGRLRARGVRLAIDYAGAGFASLRHILRLAPDIIKTDMTLTRNIFSSPAERALTSGADRLRRRDRRHHRRQGNRERGRDRRAHRARRPLRAGLSPRPTKPGHDLDPFRIRVPTGRPRGHAHGADAPRRWRLTPRHPGARDPVGRRGRPVQPLTPSPAVRQPGASAGSPRRPRARRAGRPARSRGPS